MNRIYLLFLCASSVFVSCNTDDFDGIIGDWQVVERFSDGEQIDLTSCDPYSVLVFHDDFTVSSFLLDDRNLPSGVICGVIPRGVFIWEQLDDNTFLRKHKNTNDPLLQTTFKLNGDILEARFNEPNIRVIYKRY